MDDLMEAIVATMMRSANTLACRHVRYNMTVEEGLDELRQEAQRYDVDPATLQTSLEMYKFAREELGAMDVIPPEH